MKIKLKTLLNIFWGFKKTSDLVLENLALRQQLAVMKQSVQRPQIRSIDRLFWILLSRIWGNWRDAMVVVKPETVIKWHKKGFKLFWKFKSRPKGPGRPQIRREI